MNNLDLLLPSTPGSTDYWTWATVIQTTPLRIRLDGDDAPLGITPDSLLESPFVGQRVYVQRSGRRTIVHGGAINGGGSAPVPSLHSNPSFENGDPTGGADHWIDRWSRFWMNPGTLMEWDTTSFIEGTKSVKITGGADANGRIQSRDVIPVVPFAVFTLTAWMKASQTTGVELGVLTDTTSNPDFYNGSSNLAWHDPTVTVGTTWQKYTISIVIPANHRYARVSINPNVTNRTVWIDATSSTMDTSDLDSGWINVSPVSPWQNYNAGSFSSAGYRRRDGIVYLRGLVRYGYDNSTIFTLPAGYRPAYQELFSPSTYGPSAPIVGRVDVNPNGEVRCQAGVALGSGQVSYLSLAGISFPADM